jgi:DeoR family fructose operon transcriptional repressor
MLTEERYSAILEALKNKNSMTVAEFAKMTGASESTIRRDLITLDEGGKVKRFHGGARAIEHEYITNEESVSAKAQMNVEEKRLIAQYAAGMINDDDFIFIDAGTSTAIMID